MSKRQSLLLFLGIVAVISSIWLYALLVSPSRQTLDQRVHDVALQLKCLVCQGETVADSPAMLSLQMRGIIRQQLQSGKSEQGVIQYFVSRYGDRSFYRLQCKASHYWPWVVPITLMIGGALLVFFVLRSWQSHARKEPDDTDRAEFR